MGWIKERAADHRATIAFITPLWNSLRDSIGAAVREFNETFNVPGVDRSDCEARAMPCVRVAKPGQFIEIFLSESGQSIKSVIGEWARKTRLRASV